MKEIDLSHLEMYKDHMKNNYSYIDEEILKDPEIMEFIAENDIPSEIVQRDKTALTEFYEQRYKNRTEKPVLEFYKDRILVTYEFRKNDDGQRAENKVNTRLICDSSTKKHKHKVYFKDLDIDSQNMTLYKELSNFVNDYNFEDSKGAKGIWLHGTYGIGKTHFMAALANEINKKGAGVQFASLHNLLNYLKNGMGFKVNNNQQRLEELKNSEILILDDLGIEKISDWSLKNVIYEIVDYRFVQEKPTFFTSNLSLQEYKKSLIAGGISSPLDAERLVERIEVLAREVRLTGENRRIKQ